jgi:tRNA pseudouridine55 synthase
MFGVLNVNKPVGLTSRDAVNRVQRIVRPHKVGHAGTLDPIASGVLIVCIGQATRLIEYAQRMSKLYRGTFLLGRRSDTDDVETECEVLAGACEPTLEQIEQALPRFTGAISQRPPRHSAVKIGGQRAYKLARRGVEFEPAAKTVCIHRIAVVRYDYPELVLDVECGSGTYLRSLGRDVAEALGTYAVMAALERTAIGEFRVCDAVTLEDLDAELSRRLQSPATLLAGLPSLAVTEAEIAELRHGRPVRMTALGERLCEGAAEEIAALDSAGNLVAILAERHPGLLFPVRNFT